VQSIELMKGDCWAMFVELMNEKKSEWQAQGRDHVKRSSSDDYHKIHS
jgi:hypothetical protein